MNSKTKSTLFNPQRYHIILLTIILWAIFSLPAILFAGWFPLDLGAIFKMGQNFQEWLPWILSPYNGSGRYFPLYWIYYLSQVPLFGTNVAPYFFLQSLIFLTSAILASVTIYKLTRSTRLTLLMLLTFYFSTPLAENINTLGKGEPLSYLILAVIWFIFFIKNVIKPCTLDLKNVLIDIALISPLFALAIWTKETSIVLLGLGLTGACIAVFLGKFCHLPNYTSIVKEYLCFLSTLIIGYGISKIPYVIFPANIEGSNYTDYDITLKLIAENFLFYISQQPDVIMFGVLAIILLGTAGKILFFNKKAKPDQLTTRAYIFALSLCAVAWAYYLSLLVWRWPMAYYMLLPAIIFKICAIYGIYLTNLLGLLKKQYLRFTIYPLIGLSLIYSSFYIYYITSSQIIYSRVYTDAMFKSDHYLNLPGDKHDLIIESYPFYAEQIGVQLDTGTGWRYHTAKGIADVLDPDVTSNKELLKLLNITQAQIDSNIDNVPKRGDYLLVFTGNNLATWFSRGVTPYYSKDSILKMQGAYDMELLEEKNITFPAIYINTWTHLLDMENSYIGYKLYRTLDDWPEFLWKGRFPDGWAGNVSSLLINPTYQRPVIVKISAPEYILPQKVTIRKDGEFLKELTLINTDEIILNLSDKALLKPTRFQFDAEKTFIPKELNLYKDHRKLGLLINLDTSVNKPNN